MKRKLLPKSLLLTAVILSLSSFVFVNVHAGMTQSQPVCQQTILEQPQVKESDNDADTQDIKVPDVTALGRVIELIQKFLPMAN